MYIYMYNNMTLVPIHPCSDTYVTSESGTGVVHQAPGFGEDDFRVALKYGILKKGETVVCPVDASGRFTDEVTDFKGKYVKVLYKFEAKLIS
jgi:isoleucyl-tRNA synthetase